MDEKELWNLFTQTGSVNDYLKYKEVENKAELTNANNYQGISDKGTDG